MYKIFFRVKPGRWSLVAGAVASLALTGCSGEPKAVITTSGTATAPSSLNVDTTAPGPPPPGGKSVKGDLTEAQLQSMLRNYADHFRVTMGSACDRISQDTSDPLVRRRSHALKLDGSTAIYDIVMDPVPATALLNALVMTSLQAKVLEAHGLARYGDGYEELLAASQRLEEEVWRIGARVMTGEQRTGLMAVCLQWWEKRGRSPDIWYARLEDFAAATGNPVQNLVGQFTGMPARFLDSFIPVNKAGQTLGEAQILAERVSWLTPRLMVMAQWRAEAIVYQTLATPQVREALNVGTTFAAIASNLPNEISKQREALFNDLRNSQPEISALLNDVKQTIASTETLSSDALKLADQGEVLLASAQDLVGEVDRVVARVESMQAADLADAAANPRPASTQPSRPFDITEYTQALNAATVTLREAQSAITLAQDVTQPAQLEERLGVVDGTVSGLIWLAGGVFAGAGLLVVLAVKLIPGRSGSHA